MGNLSTAHPMRWVLPLAIVLMLMLSGCAMSPARNPLPENLSGQARIPGYPDGIRFWGDKPVAQVDKWLTATEAEVEHQFPDLFAQEQVYLAVSGGGPRGAYGVGILSGWTDTGTRPEFALVTGISTGALIAPFAFLGSDYDDTLEEAYTSLTTEDVAEMRSKLSVLYNDAMADSAPLRAHIAKYVTQDVVNAIAREHRRGRRLFIATTNLDALRPVIWNIGLIAGTDRPDAAELIRTIMLASASIPTAFPPQYIQVEAGGQRYDEIHVDGGMISQAFLYPVGMDWSVVLKKLKVKGKPRAYVIRNSRLRPDWVAMDPSRTLSIAGRSTESLIRTQGLGDLYRIHYEAKRDGLDYFWTAIPDDFDVVPKEPFDPAYMKKLIEIGRQRIMSETAWKSVPPDY